MEVIKSKKPTKNYKTKKYTEGEISLEFDLTRVFIELESLKHWLNVGFKSESEDEFEKKLGIKSLPPLNEFELYLFNKILIKAKENIEAWNEEDLKMNFIAHIIELSHFEPTRIIRTFFEKTISATVSGVYLKTIPDFMIAKGLRNVATNPYFHFQEYKRETDPNGDPLGQLLEAFLIAQEINQNEKPMYGAYIVGRYWYFVTMEHKEYCVSKSFDSTEKDQLMKIIAILRHFKIILETTLIIV